MIPEPRYAEARHLLNAVPLRHRPDLLHVAVPPWWRIAAQLEVDGVTETMWELATLDEKVGYVVVALEVVQPVRRTVGGAERFLAPAHTPERWRELGVRPRPRWRRWLDRVLPGHADR